MISTAMKVKLLMLASKYGVEIEHFTPGYVVAYIASWRQYEREFISLINALRNDPHITKIIWDKGFVEVQYDPHILNNPAIINDWLKMLEQYSLA